MLAVCYQTARVGTAHAGVPIRPPARASEPATQQRIVGNAGTATLTIGNRTGALKWSKAERSRKGVRMAHATTQARPRRPKEETARLGDEIYRREIKAQVEARHDGEYVAIDVDSGRWAIAESELVASDSLRKKCPDAIDVWLLRVGYRAVASIGGGSLRRAE